MTNENSPCVPDAGPGGPVWRKSSYSGNNGGQCVEVALHDGNGTSLCLLRDSKDREGPVLAFAPAEWRAFTAGIKAGEFDPS
jgi:hypothetical protein